MLRIPSKIVTTHGWPGRLSKWLNYAKESPGIKQKEIRVVSASLTVCALFWS